MYAYNFKKIEFKFLSHFLRFTLFLWKTEQRDREREKEIER